MNLINHNNQDVPLSKFKIQYNVCMTLANISFNEEGKAAIVQKGYIK